MEQKRKAPRQERRLPIEYAVETTDDWRGATTRNLSTVGVFVETVASPPFGARLTLRFHLATQTEAIQIAGQVRWADDSGFGVQFDGLRARDAWALGKYLEEA